MQATGVTMAQLLDSARAIGVNAEVTTLNTAGTRHRVKLYPHAWQRPEEALTARGNRRKDERGDRKYQRLSASAFSDTRRVHAVCWHGFWDFFREVFKVAPDAVFRTSLDTWKGSEDFEAEVCRCGDKERTMRDLQSAVLEGQDIIDPRDVRIRIDELESERDSAGEDATTCDHEDCQATEVHRADAFVAWDETDEAEELKALRALAGEMSDDEPLIADHYFEEYARQLAEDIGALKHCDSWPATCIDWERAAHELQVDYTSLEYGSTTYWQRC